MKQITLAASLALALAALGGCSIFGRPATDQAQYYLEAGPPPARSAADDAKPAFPVISVRRATAVAPFDGLGFVYAQQDGTWRADAYAGWIASPGAMLTSALAEYMARSGRFGVVVGQSAISSDRVDVSVVIERLYADFRGDAGGRAVVRLRWYLVGPDDAAPGDRIYASGVAESDAAIASRAPGAVADAFSAALTDAFGRIVEGLAANAPKKAG